MTAVLQGWGWEQTAPWTWSHEQEGDLRLLSDNMTASWHKLRESFSAGKISVVRTGVTAQAWSMCNFLLQGAKKLKDFLQVQTCMVEQF